MFEEVGIKLKKSYRFDITIAFIMFAFFIVISITSIGMFYFTKLSKDEFQSRVLLSSKNIDYLFYQKQKSAQNAIKAIINGTILKEFKTNNGILEIIFKTFLISNDDFKQISYTQNGNQFFCKKDNKIFCNYQKDEGQNRDKLSFITVEQIDENRSLSIKTTLNSFFNSIPNEIFHILIIDNGGNILYTNFLKAKTIFDMFNSDLATKILTKNNQFITNDIYVNKIDGFKIIFMQNKTFLKKQKVIARNLAITILILSFILAIPFGFFFSKPLYEFYDLLNKRVFEEIEKNREKEQMLMHQSKLAALGEMLGNIAHQWRHPITRLSLLVQNLKRAYEYNKVDDEFMKKFENKAFEQINYMSQTIDDFTNFFKKDKEKQEFYIDDVIDEALKLIEGRLKNIEIIKNYGEKQEIKGYKTEFSQVILNILNNSVDVLNERGVKDKKIYINLKNSLIEIEDNGGGVSDEIIGKIFDPYFTTKFQNQGTGIGLYMSKIIITKHFFGKLEVKNSEKGAVFTIVL